MILKRKLNKQLKISKIYNTVLYFLQSITVFEEFIWIYQCFNHSFAEVRNGYFNYDRYC